VNLLERKMVDVLKDLKEHHHVAGIKAEFEAEGTRLEEVLRLKEIVLSAGLGLTIKIGGCEALRDMYECRVIGVERIVAPMVESPYALRKFLAATKLAYPAEERPTVVFAVNVETRIACDNFEAMLALPEISELQGVVLGRGDLACSLGLTRDDINCRQVFELSREVLVKAKARGMQTVIGGGVSAMSLPFFRELPSGCLDMYETRKVIFRCPGALGENADKGILKAVGFELLWLKNKRDYYSLIAMEDAQRIQTLESRYKASIEAAGGKYE